MTTEAISDTTLRGSQRIVLLLAACVALMMTGFGIIMPVFARRLGELGSGVEALGMMTMSFALAQLIASPFMGTFADRYGRRPVILVALVAFALANIGYLLAGSTAAFIAVRSLGGFFTAGLLPASMAVVADTIPESGRGKWVGIVMGGYGFGFVFGPVLGGFLYDGWGFSAPFAASALMGFLAFMAAFLFVSETRTPEIHSGETPALPPVDEPEFPPTASFWDSLPRPLPVFATLLFLDFVVSFAFAFVEPQMVFYVYEELDWSTIEFGIVIGGYGLTMVLGQFLLAQLSDRFGRKPVIVTGFILDLTFYVGLVLFSSFEWVFLAALVSGLGGALFTPALSAFYLDITAKRHRGRVMGMKESALALGGITGPLLVAVVSGWLDPRSIFAVSAILTGVGMLLALVILREPERRAGTTGTDSLL